MTIPKQAVDPSEEVLKALDTLLEMPAACTTDAEVIENNRRREQARLVLRRSRLPQTISPSDPFVTIAGIRQFGLASDGSDLRDLEAAFARRPHTGQPQEEANAGGAFELGYNTALALNPAPPHITNKESK